MKANSDKNGCVALPQLSVLFTGTIRSTGWSFTTPGSVTGMKGSCVVIPCTFTYSVSMPADLRVIWYLFQGDQFSPVFDERQNVISKYRGMTSLIGAVRKQDCSLKIDKLDKIHGQDRLFPWIDKNPITFYHMEGHSFYDKTTQIVILGRYIDRPTLSFTLVIFPNHAFHSLIFVRLCTRATAQHL